jgi:hypothetical protein
MESDMTDLKKSIGPVLILACALFCGPSLIGGCTQAKMTTMWRDPAYQAGTMTKVFAIAVRKDPVRRRLWEDAFVAELKAHGVSGLASYSLFPSAVPDSLQVSDLVHSEGYDGVALSVRLPDETERTYMPGYTKRELVTVSRPFLRGYTTYWQDIQVPGYVETNEVRRFQTSVWTTQDGGRMIWSGTNESSDYAVQGPVEDVMREQIGVELVAAGILPPLTP